MTKALFALVFIVFGHYIAYTQNGQDLAKISGAVHAFSQAGDSQDAARLDLVLHPQFRAVVHRAFGSPELSLMDKSLYLQLMRDKKIGGDKREVHLLEVDVVNNIAQVRVLLLGKALRFHTYISLVKLDDGSWQIVGDMPDISKA
jgi:Putative lumazine-binding